MSDIFTLITAPLIISFCFTAALAVIALNSYSRTGPKIKHVIEHDFICYAIGSFVRLLAWSIVIIFFTSTPGCFFLYLVSYLLNINLLTPTNTILASLIFFALTTLFALSHTLFYIPACLQLSTQFRFSRLQPLWRLLTPARLWLFETVLSLIVLISCFFLLVLSAFQYDLLWFIHALLVLVVYFFLLPSSRVTDEQTSHYDFTAAGFNIVLIGSDTLRIDRLGQYAYPRNLTPNIDKLCASGVMFENCITPLARTAPSLTSFLTALWPHNHKIRDNYPNPEQTKPAYNFIDILNNNGYITSVISDWAGSDFKKISFGFQKQSVPEDQWNLKLLLRQGPAYLRFFLSLFAHNRLGKYFLPEIYYLAGVPLTSHLGRQCRQMISNLAGKKHPFLINLFTSTTHVPFGSRYPYYNLFTPKDYQGESRFIMSDLSTPEQIIESQESTAENHDLSQIINLYDSCVKEFDDEVGKIVEHIENCGISENTYIVIYSDHGTDFFETECWGQGNTLIGNDPSARIPLIICGPNVPKNVKFSHVCRSIDFMPTMLDLLGLEIPKNIDGVSLAPYLADNLNPNLYAYQETGVWMGSIPGLHPDQITYPDIIELLSIPDTKSGTMVIDEKYYPTVIKAKNRSIQDDRWKLIYIPTYSGPVYQLYDLQTDPYRNVIDLYPEIVDILRPKLDAWIQSSPVAT